MNYPKENEVSQRNPISAKNAIGGQEHCEKERKNSEKLKTVLNGRVKTDSTVNDDLGGETEVEYEFLYSVSDEENGDHYSYEFDAYPAVPEVPSSVVPEDIEYKTFVQGAELPVSLPNDISQNDKKYLKQLKRVKSANVVVSDKQRGCLSVRPKSASLADGRKTELTDEKKTELIVKGDFGVRSKGRLTKEVAFRDTESVVSKISSCRSKDSANNKTRDNARRKSVSYDPDLEKASAFIHGGGKNFSRSNTSLSPVKYGMKHLQMNYTETNLETNQSVIFLDLLKSSHQRSQIRGDQIRNIERRLEAKRNNPCYSTSFYENKDIPDPFHRNTKKTARSVAQKKIERKEKIKQMTDEIHTGYVPTQLTMKIADRCEVEDIGKRCRYLRCQTPSGI